MITPGQLLHYVPEGFHAAEGQYSDAAVSHLCNEALLLAGI
jgi:hypothetical protein